MATVLIAVLVALLLGHVLPDLARLRDFSWVSHWYAWLNRRGDKLPLWRHPAGLLIGLAPPLLLIGAMQCLFHGRWFGLAGFALAVVVVFYCWGPRDLDLDIEAIVKAPDSERRLAAAQALAAPGGAPVAVEAGSLIDATFFAALQRWFGVLLWFLLLGPAGALLYRLVHLVAFQPTISAELPDAQRGAAQRLAGFLDWPAAQLMTLALAVAADFDAVAKSWRDWHSARGKGYFALDVGFLSAVGRASVDADVEGGDGFVDDAQGPLPALNEAMQLVWRILTVWLTLLGLVVLGGFVA